jgi:predicted DNA-binding protein with PD1-like motif
VIAARLFEGEDVYACIQEIAETEEIDCAAVLITGGLSRASVVVGPKQVKPEIKGDYRDFEGPGEVFGVGTIYRDDEGAKLHLHAGMGRGDTMMVGCPRGGAETFLVLEVTIIELKGVEGARQFDAESGLKLLRFARGQGGGSGR